MLSDNRYKGIIFMLIAALGFSVMGGAAKILQGSFNAGQLVFWRNAVGVVALAVSFLVQKPVIRQGRPRLLIFRGLMGTISLYTLLYCILHLPLGTAMTYNLTSALFIAVFSFILFREYNGHIVLVAVLLGFTGMLLIYKPAGNYPWFYHAAGLLSGMSSALAYMSVNRLAAYYEPRIIVLAFIGSGLLVPALFMTTRAVFNIQADEILFIDWRWPIGREWGYILWLGLAAIFGQYFVTRAYGADKAGVVSAIGYANIVFSLFIGMALGDAFPDAWSAAGIVCIILSGVMIALVKRRRTG